MNRRGMVSGSRLFLKAGQGFTLLEILLAVFIFSIVVTTIFSTFNSVVSRTEAIKNGTDDFEMARMCLNRITADLNAVYLDQKPLYKPPDIDDDPDPYRFVGKETQSGGKSFSQLRFASTEHLPLTGKPEKGIAEIVYYVAEVNDPDAEETRYVLKRSDTIHPEAIKKKEFEPNENDPVLCENIEELAFVYFDADGNPLEEWDSDSSDLKYATPTALEIRLKMIAGNDHYAFTTKILLPVFREKFE